MQIKQGQSSGVERSGSRAPSCVIRSTLGSSEPPLNSHTETPQLFLRNLSFLSDKQTQVVITELHLGYYAECEIYSPSISLKESF